MDVDGDGAGQERSAGLEEQLAGVVEQLLTDRAGAKDAISALEALYHGEAERLRDQSSQQMHRPARVMRLKALADEMQCQASTWHLVWCLYCNDSGPAGIGGPDVQDAGDQRTYRQLLADKACMDPLLARVASVVAWLESLAADELSRQGVPRFADHDGVWIETRQQAGAGLVSELDPDAPSRQGKALHVDNAKAEDRLLLRLWQLVRAGRVRDARALCGQCGQPWRSVSIGGGGGFGPLPVGLAAAQLDDGLGPELQAQDLAIETAAGAGTLRALWKWACLATATRMARGGGAGGTAARYETALYGALCGDVTAVLPVCGTWEDACWAYCRAWLDLSTDQALGISQQQPHELVGGEVLMGVLQRCGLGGGNGIDGAGLGSSAVDGALAVVLGGQWPVSSLLQPLPAAATAGAGGGDGFGTASQLLGSFSEVFDALLSSPEPAIRAAGKEPLHQVQQLLVQGRLAGLTAHLHRWLVSQEQQQQPGGPSTPGTGAGAAAPWAVSLSPAPGPAGDDAGGEEAAGLPPRQLRMVAYSAHLLLLLEALGEHVADAENSGSLEQVRGMREQLLVLYIAGLLEAGHLQLVPQYLPLTQFTNRRLLAHELLLLLTQQLHEAAGSSLEAATAAGPQGAGAVPGPSSGTRGEAGDAWAQADGQCARVYCSMAAWLQACLVRQQQQQEAEAEGGGMMQGAGGTSNALHTGVGPDEARLLLVSFVDACRMSANYGPLFRARAARWLTYPLLYPGVADSASQADAEAAAASAAASGAEIGEPAAFLDLLRLVCTLCSEMALGDDVTAAAAQQLLTRTLPQDVEVRAQRLHAQLLEAAAAAHDPPPPDSAAMVDEQQQDAEAAAAAAAAEGTARELEGLVSELGSWRLYFALDDAMQAWERQYARHAQQYGSGPAARGAAGQGGASWQQLAEGARSLLDSMLSQLLEGGWLGPLADPARAWVEEAEAASGSGEGVEVELVLSRLPDEWEAQVQRREPGAPAWASGNAPFPALKGAKLFEAESQLRAALATALSQDRGADAVAAQLVAAQVLSPEGAEGYVRVHLTCRPSTEAWYALVGLVVGILQGSIEGLPSQLVLVNMQAGRATSAAICRRCCLGKVVLRCSRLRQALVELGGDGNDGELLVQLLASGGQTRFGAAEAAGAGGLLEVLSGAMLQQVLKAEADTITAAMQAQQQRQG